MPDIDISEVAEAIAAVVELAIAAIVEVPISIRDVYADKGLL